MESETLKALQKDFPGFYDKLHALECGDGWLAIIYDLSMKIKDHLKRCEEDHRLDDPFRATQIKEKYGALEYYTETVVCRHIRELIEDAYRESRIICEICGDKGELGLLGNYSYTRCQNCWEKLREPKE